MSGVDDFEREACVQDTDGRCQLLTANTCGNPVREANRPETGNERHDNERKRNRAQKPDEQTRGDGQSDPGAPVKQLWRPSFSESKDHRLRCVDDVVAQGQASKERDTYHDSYAKDDQQTFIQRSEAERSETRHRCVWLTIQRRDWKFDCSRECTARMLLVCWLVFPETGGFDRPAVTATSNSSRRRQECTHRAP